MAKVVIASNEFEISFLTKKLKCEKQKPILDFSIYRSARPGKDIFVLRSSPGIANAAAAAALAIEHYRPEHIFNVGVCGVCSSDKKLLTRVIAGSMAIFADAGVETEDEFLPMQSVDLHLAKLKNGTKVFNIIKLNDEAVSKKIPRGVFLTVSASSGSEQRSDKMKNRFKINQGKLICEDMESAAIGLIALKASIPCTVLRGISNLCGDRDYKAWKLSEAAEAAQKELLKCL
jgi:futalosine hydrolase